MAKHKGVVVRPRRTATARSKMVTREPLGLTPGDAIERVIVRQYA